MYPWISVDMKKLCEYPHNGYTTDTDTGIGWIFIQRVGYEGATTHTLVVGCLTFSLHVTDFRISNLVFSQIFLCFMVFHSFPK